MTEEKSRLLKLPNGWTWSLLEDLSNKIANGITRRQSKEKKGIPVSRIETISNGYIDINKVGYLNNLESDLIEKFSLRKGDILFSHINSDSHLGKTAIFDIDDFVLLHGMNLLLIRPNTEMIDSKFLHYLCNYYRNLGYFISIAQHAVNQSSINQSKMKALVIPLAPIPEQRRIVYKIEELFSRLDAGVEALQKAKAQLKRYRQAVLKAAAEGRLTEEWRKANKTEQNPSTISLHYSNVDLDTDKLQRLPDLWYWSTLGQCFDIKRGRFSIRPRNDPRYYNGPYPFVQIGDLPPEGGKIVRFTQTLNEEGLRISRMFPKGTVLIAIVGATIANTGMLTFDSCCPDSLVGFQFQNGVSLLFLEYYLRYKKHEIRNTSYSSGGQPNINLKVLYPYPIPIPPLTEQYAIIKEVEYLLANADEVENSIKRSTGYIQRLRQSILKRAFEGKLVPQDPNNEPASALLDRIKTERAKEPSRRGRRSNNTHQMRLIQ